MPKGKKGSLALPERVVSRIFLVRGQKVMLDADLAELYGVTTKRLNEQVRRNIDRFPADFMFRPNAREYRFLRSQFATLKQGRGEHRKYLPFVFTEHGAVMAASVLDSERAVGRQVVSGKAWSRRHPSAPGNAASVCAQQGQSMA